MALPPATQAQQIFKCPDANGRMHYTDQPCAGATDRHRVRITENALDGSHSRRAVEQWRQERQAQAEWAAARDRSAAGSWACENARRNLGTQSHNAPRQRRTQHTRDRAPLPGMVTSREERLSRERDAVAENCHIDRASLEPPPPPAPKPREDAAPAPPPPSVITHCNSGFCHDNQGGVYHRGGGTFLSGPQGQACQQVGNMIHCH